jgi:flagellar L-ring protein FlgH
MKYLAIVLIMIITTSCASFLEQPQEDQGDEFVNSLTKYNENPNHGIWGNRQYKKTTKSQLEEDSDLTSSAGSLWVMDGQQSYYFTQNKIRKEGDFLNVKLEGAAFKQVETKVKVIKTLLQELEDQEKESVAPKLAESAKPAESKDIRTPAAVGETKKADGEEDKGELADVGPVQTRIIERLADGNYRIKGQQPFMIGKRDYRVLVVGIVRPEDYNDEGISSSKLIDPQFDVVSIRKKEAQ